MISNLFQHLNLGKLALEPPALNPIGGCLLMLLAGLVYAAYVRIVQRSRHHAKRLKAKYGNIAFAWAIQSKDIGLVRKIAALNPDPDVSLDGFSALELAILTNDAAIVREVVKLRPNPFTSGLRERPLMAAARRVTTWAFDFKTAELEIFKEVLKLYPTSNFGATSDIGKLFFEDSGLKDIFHVAVTSDEWVWELVVREILKRNLSEKDLLEAMQLAKSSGTIREILKYM